MVVALREQPVQCCPPVRVVAVEVVGSILQALHLLVVLALHRVEVAVVEVVVLALLVLVAQVLSEVTVLFTFGGSHDESTRYH